MSQSASTYEVSAEHHRLRLDRFVLLARPDLSRRAVDRMLRSGLVLVNGHPRDARYFVKHGERVEVREAVPRPGEEPHEILRTAHLIAVAKPPGMPTNPVPGSTRCVLAWAEQHIERGSPGIVHRLDLDTSGIVLLSLSPEGHRLLEAAFAQRTIQKSYIALVPGRLHPNRGTIDKPIARDASGRMHADPRGRPSRTSYETISGTPTFSLLELRPESGRTHQIRVHLASIGHPIAGDPLYGDPRHTLGAPRLWLHAFALELPPPLAATLEAPERMECPLWEDLRIHLGALGGTLGR